MAERKITPWRAELWNSSVYLIRDVWLDDGRLGGCLYAVQDGEEIVWRPCVEGVMFADIQPLVTING